METILAAPPDAPRDHHGPAAELATLRVLVRWVAKTIDYAQLDPHDVLASCGPGHLNLMALIAGSADRNAAAETAASTAIALTILNARNVAEASQIWRDLMIAATHGRIRRLTESDQNALIPFIRSAYRSAYIDANAQHKLRRRFSTSAAKHQLLRPEGGSGRLTR
ncbi:hypothetical protein [Mycolicibacterium septicum]|nr:hypothetical protein [Mycolicibacterium septicum]